MKPTNYGYDAIYELLTASQGTRTKESYTYDPVAGGLPFAVLFFAKGGRLYTSIFLFSPFHTFPHPIRTVPIK